MIISASRRTDLPAFYMPWFMERVRAGFCEVVNPCNRAQVSRVSLRPEDVEAIVFWTRNAAPLLPHLPELDARGYRYCVQYTLTGYGRELEPGVPAMAEVVQTMRQLAEHLGSQRVLWRYDPILFTGRTPPAYHAAQFATLAAALAGVTCRATVSLADDYRAARRRLQALAGQGFAPLAVDPAGEEFAVLMRGLAETAGAHGMAMVSCAETVDLRPYGIAPGKCIDDAYLRDIFGIRVPSRKDPSQRPACGCVPSKDIGAYDTCPHACAYCYATHQSPRAERHYRNHRVEGTRLGE